MKESMAVMHITVKSNTHADAFSTKKSNATIHDHRQEAYGAFKIR